jgi:hypothetical protein
MSWSYDVTALATSPKDQIRLRIGDTDESDPIMEDEEIMFYIGDNEEVTSSVLLSCVNACITRVSGLPEYKLGPYSESHKARLDAWQAIKATLEANAYSQHAPISEPPTTAPIFSYDFMSSHCCGGGARE